MARKFTESTTTMVFGILEDYYNQFLSVRQIRFKIYEKHKCSLSHETVKNNITELITLKIEIEKEVQRLGAKRTPTTVFKLINHSIKLQTCSE